MASAQFGLNVPAGWSAKPTGPVPTIVEPGQTVSIGFQVSVPEAAQGSQASLLANLTRPPVTVQFSASAPIVSGLSVTPASGSITVPPQGATTTVSLAATAAAPGGTAEIPVAFTFNDQGTTFPLTTLRLHANVPFASLSAAFGNTGITSNSNTAAGDFDGTGNTFSEQNLAASGLSPGGTVYQDGVALTWPDVSAGALGRVATAVAPERLERPETRWHGFCGGSWLFQPL